MFIYEDTGLVWHIMLTQIHDVFRCDLAVYFINTLSKKYNCGFRKDYFVWHGVYV